MGDLSGQGAAGASNHQDDQPLVGMNAEEMDAARYSSNQLSIVPPDADAARAEGAGGRIQTSLSAKRNWGSQPVNNFSKIQKNSDL